MDKKDILYQCLNDLDRQSILDAARANEEKPFGFVIDYIKYTYNLSKIDGWNIAEAVLAFFEICNDR